MKDLLKISRTLSKGLRHDPNSISIKLDNGWTTVESLCEGVGITFEELEEVVHSNDKQRFEFNDEKTMIRARQGHSVKVDLNLVETQPPMILYHGTSDAVVSSIMKTGIDKRKRHHVHLSESLITAEKVGGRRKGDTVILKVDSAAMRAAGCKFYKTENNVWLTDFVDPKYITR